MPICTWALQRRVRRLATGQTTDAFLGSDLMIEGLRRLQRPHLGHEVDLQGHQERDPAHVEPQRAEAGRRHAAGVRRLQVLETSAGRAAAPREGTWQLREVYVLEAAPVNANHPVSKRVFYMDAQLGPNLNGANEIYDRKGELWKVFMVGKSHPDSHLPINKGSGIGIDDAFSMVDVQSKHCTTGQFKGQVGPKPEPRRVHVPGAVHARW